MASTETSTNELSTSKHEEYQYLELIQQILNQGELTENRTNIDTYSVLGWNSTYPNPFLS